jgi:hypothetical protein
VAEVCRLYSNFRLPPFEALDEPLSAVVPTLVAQSEGVGSLQPAVDLEAAGPWRSVLPYMDEVVQLYEAGYSLTAIEKKLGITWDSVARLLDKAGVRDRRVPPT